VGFTRLRLGITSEQEEIDEIVKNYPQSMIDVLPKTNQLKNEIKDFLGTLKFDSSHLSEIEQQKFIRTQFDIVSWYFGLTYDELVEKYPELLI